MISEDEVRRQADAMVGIEGGISSYVWTYLVDEGMVAAVMRGEQDIPWLTDRFWAFARASGLERKLKQPPPVLTEQQRQRANDHQTVLAILLARAAANENAVREFRKRALDDHVLPPTDVEAWLQQQAAKDGKPTVWLQDVAIPPGYEVQRLPRSWLSFTRPPLLISEEHPGRASSRMLACALPGRPPIAFITSAGGILEELRKLSQRLAREFSWSSMQAVLFVLTDEVPTVPLVKVTIEYSSQRPACTRIMLDVDPTASPSLVAEHFRQTRRKVFSRRVRTISLDHLKLAAFVAEHPGKAFWSALFEEWNRKHPQRRYQRRNIFKRDSLRARMRVLTLGMPHPRRTYLEDEGMLVPLARDNRKADSKHSRTSRSRKQSTRGTRNLGK